MSYTIKTQTTFDKDETVSSNLVWRYVSEASFTCPGTENSHVLNYALWVRSVVLRFFNGVRIIFKNKILDLRHY